MRLRDLVTTMCIGAANVTLALSATKRAEAEMAKKAPNKHDKATARSTEVAKKKANEQAKAEAASREKERLAAKFRVNLEAGAIVVSGDAKSAMQMAVA